MYRKRVPISIKNLSLAKEKLVHWANHKYASICWLDSNENPYTNFQATLAIGSLSSISIDSKNAFSQLKDYINSINDYAFGYLGYDLKNDTEDLISKNKDIVDFEDLHFFQPEKIIHFSDDSLIFEYLESQENEIEKDFLEILNFEILEEIQQGEPYIKSRISKDEYLEKTKAVLKDIHRGDIYELNFCQEFYAENTNINPTKKYWDLNKISTPPFACFLKNKDKYLLSASPERFLRKEGDYLVSEPIKGTAKRYEDPTSDNQAKLSLKTNTKEIAENVMIVDLVRNDLSHIAQKGTVKVEELCEVYSYQQVHQMISKISCKIKEASHPVDIIKHCFPMGSMTGAPKISAMKLIEKYEESKRGLYSGTVGYITPNGDFDFNVVIRSILYNETKKALSFSVGSAITAKANPENEYEECLLKAKAMREVLENIR